MDNFVVKHYHSDNLECLSDFDACFYQQEVINSVLLALFSKEQPSSSCSVVVDKNTNTLIFALFALRDSYLYASGISSSIEKSLHKPVVNLLVQDFLSTSFPFIGLYSFDPALPLVLEALQTHGNIKFKLSDSTWSCNAEKVEWSPRSLEIKNDKRTSLRKATLKELPLLKEWTEAFLDHFSMGNFIDVDEACQNEIEQEHVYILYQDDTPVSMAWKRRPFRKSCAIAYVYTPPEYRHKGLGKVCVAMTTEVILKDYKYATLFVHSKQDPHNNLYTAIGYKYLGIRAERYDVVE